MVKEINSTEEFDNFPELSRKVIELLERVRDSLFSLDEKAAINLAQDSNYLHNELRKAESLCNDSLLVGITGQEDRFLLVASAQRCSRLKKVVNQVTTIIQGIQDLAGHIQLDDTKRLHQPYTLALQEMKDAILSILREDEELAFSVRKQDKILDALYQEELAHIFQQSVQAASYPFQTATNLLFILRAIERIGDHAKHLAVPSFYHLVNYK